MKSKLNLDPKVVDSARQHAANNHSETFGS